MIIDLVLQIALFEGFFKKENIKQQKKEHIE
jgi:hypothetical protein